MTEREDLRAFFSRSVEACMDPLYGVAFRLTRNSADAEDLVAEAVAKAWSAFDSLDDRDRFRPWLFRILHNYFISDYRKKSIRPTESSLDEQFADEGEGDVTSLLNDQPDDFLRWWANPEKVLLNNLLGEKIMAAIDDLPKAFRIAILLVNVEGLTYDEAAEALGVPTGTVRSRMKRGRTLLQKALWEQAKDAGLTVGDNMNGCRL
jgi:RNA polymerase sigma-70 factor (ECF subfamily)